MSNKARALGNVARQNVVLAEQCLARVDRLLAPIAGGESMPLKDYEFLATKAQHANAEARRLLEKTLGMGTGPLSQEEQT